jgi:uncharacterized protein YhbP (UPF0306 family)
MAEAMVDHEADELREYVRRFLQERFTMALATEGPDGPWIAAVYFAGGLDALCFLSSPDSRHGRNLSSSPRIAAAINEDEHDWRSIRGVQLEGTCVLADSGAVWLRGWRACLAKFPVARDLFRGRAGDRVASQVLHARLYVVRPHRLFYLDNRLGFSDRREILAEHEQRCLELRTAALNSACWRLRRFLPGSGSDNHLESTRWLLRQAANPPPPPGTPSH